MTMFEHLSISKNCFESLKEDVLPITKEQIHDTWFCRLSAGSMRVLFNHHEYEVSADGGDCLFIVADGKSFNIISTSEDFKLEYITVGFDCLSMVYPYLGRKANAALTFPHLITTSQMPPYAAIMLGRQFMQLSDILEEKRMSLTRNRIIVHLLTCTILMMSNGIIIDEQMGGSKFVTGTLSSTQSYRLMCRLYEIFEEPEALCHHDVKYFADRLNISTRYFYQICMKESGISAKALINNFLISHIRHLLLNTTLSFQQISHRFNFPDQAAFTIYFKRHVGMTPSEYQERYK